MLKWLTGAPSLETTARELYGKVVAAARQTAFYRDLGVPDTPEGRYEMVVLHLFLALERLNQEGAAGRDLAQATLEAFVTDMDDCMREMGVGDTVVPKRVKRAAAGFYERAGVYRAALQQAGDEDMTTALAAAIEAKGPSSTAAMTRLARYMRNGAAALATESSSNVLRGNVMFPIFS